MAADSTLPLTSEIDWRSTRNDKVGRIKAHCHLMDEEDALADTLMITLTVIGSPCGVPVLPQNPA